MPRFSFEIMLDGKVRLGTQNTSCCQALLIERLLDFGTVVVIGAVVLFSSDL
jgi:hypothetical protein